MEIDLHGYYLKEAKEEITKKISECHKKNISDLRIIHGFNNGLKIKNYILSDEVKNNPFVLSVVPDLLNSGATKIIIKTKLK